jgi:hypothetical protein
MIQSANQVTIYGLLGESRKFIIPPFQRDYKWGEKEIEALIDDISSEIVWETGEPPRPYFLGALVTCTSEGSNDLEILDGQQRLTTISILLRVIWRLIHFKYGPPPGVEVNVNSLLISHGLRSLPDTKLQLHDPDEKDGDHQVFRDIILTDEEELKLEKANKVRRGRKGNSAAMKTGIYKAYKKAMQKVDDIVEQNYKSVGSKVDAALLLAATIKNVNVIHIRSLSEADAFLLFETLNDRGLDLSAADLIKNKILQNAKKHSINTLSNQWKKMSKNCCSTKSGSSRVVDFLRAYWNAEKGFVRKPELYDVYAKLIGRPGESNFNVKELCDELVQYSDYYNYLLEPSNIDRGTGFPGHELEKIRKHLSFIRSLGFVALRPLIMCTMRNRPDLVLRIIVFSEIVAVRNLGGNTNKIEKAYSQACHSLLNKDLSDEEAFAQVKSNFIGLIPDKQKLLSAIIDYNFNEDNSRAVLIRIDQHLRSKARNKKNTAYDSKPAQELHLEHIYPINPSEKSKLEFYSNERESDDDKDSITWKIGNLTLLESSDNQSIQNKAYSEKRTTYRDSEYFLTNLIVEDHTKWTLEDVRNRTIKLAEIIDEIWTKY